VLYISGYTSDEVVQKGGDGIAGFVQKPFTSETLLRNIRERLAAPVERADVVAEDRLA
jgi:FixJ family two-component response regulator